MADLYSYVLSMEARKGEAVGVDHVHGGQSSEAVDTIEDGDQMNSSMQHAVESQVGIVEDTSQRLSNNGTEGRFSVDVTRPIKVSSAEWIDPRQKQYSQIDTVLCKRPSALVLGVFEEGELLDGLSK
ncbi:hypothetical protein GN244_ATG09370 [Phytophthora infestans]|uniref:Uncharacterized protein n=1 Tax=Phytophthora infestans TaxID=4787 RepID=A0A833WV03_PHYIN|nr:hypothetical protein GN244_ATG09370 [Phytophthora infestans]KAF4135663.1 hypothetical protein GN958_ATG15142 [Phytophthora infestans]KAF4138674.1 hypothetical protein GN958_ATG12110 [Phytophthora infestans]